MNWPEASVYITLFISAAWVLRGAPLFSFGTRNITYVGYPKPPEENVDGR